MNLTTTYWLQSANVGPQGIKEKPSDGGIAIIGSGLAGISVAYFLLESNYSDLTIIDCGTENASYFRNAGHILHGTCESYYATSELHGRSKAKDLFKLSEQFVLQYQDTITKLNIDCEYHPGNYYFVPSNAEEEKQIIKSIEMMKEDGFNYSYVASEAELRSFGFREVFSARGCTISAQANPAKFRHQLLQYLINRGVKYHSFKVKEISGDINQTTVTYENGSASSHDALVIAGNAYSPLFSSFFKEKKLIEPFKGQIQVSKPLKTQTKRMAFSMDFGYIYGTTTADNRLLIGGWRNNVPGGEMGTYDLNLNEVIIKGLDQYVKDHFTFEELEWEYKWVGIMGANSHGLPYIGPTSSPLIYACCSCNGYGFSWSHGSGKLLADMILGSRLPTGWNYFDLRGV